MSGSTSVRTFFFCALLSWGFSPALLGQGISVTTSVPLSNDTVFLCLSNPTVSFSASYTGTKDSVVWIFQSGNPSTGYGQGSHQVAYSNTGNFFVRARVYHGGMPVATKIVWVNVQQLSPISFNPSKTIFCQSDSRFTLNGFSPPGGYFRGPGVNGNKFDPDATGAGNKTLWYVVKNGGCKDSASVVMNVKATPNTVIQSTGNVTTFQGVTVYTICQGSVPNFTFFSATPVNEYNSFTLNFGDGSPPLTGSSFPTNVSHVYGPGRFTVTLTMTAANGCSRSTSIELFHGSNPAVGLNLSGNNEACLKSLDDSVGYYFPITGTSSNPPGTVYTLIFNDGSNPITYSHPPPDSVFHSFKKGSCGTNATTFNNAFQAKIIASNPCASSAATVEPIFISEPARPDFDAIKRACVNKNVNIYDSSYSGSFVNGQNYLTCGTTAKIVWSIAPGTYTLNSGLLGQRIDPHHPTQWFTGSSTLGVTFHNTGTYTIKQVVGSVQACNIDSLEQTICIDSLPVADLALSGDTICVGDSITASFDGDIQGICNLLDIRWKDPKAAHCQLGLTGALDTTQNYIFNRVGVYPIRMVAENTCDSVVVFDTVVVRGIPTGKFPNDTAICGLATVDFGAPHLQPQVFDSLSDVSFNWSLSPTTGWSFAGGTSATSALAQIDFTQYGTYQVFLTVSSICGSYTDTMQVKLTEKPELAAVYLPLADTTVCPGTSLVYKVSATKGLQPYQFSWGSWSQGAISSADSIVLNNLVADTTIYITVTDALGCSDSAAFRVSVMPAPLVDAGSFVQTCAPDPVQLNGTLLGGTGPFTYQWTPAAGLSATNILNPIRSPLDSSVTYTLRVTDSLGCVYTDTLTVGVFPPPLFSAGSNFTLCVNQGDTLLSGATPAGGIWSGTGISGNVFSPAAAGVGSHVLVYQYTDGNSCTYRDSVVAGVIQQPSPNFGMSLIQGCSPLTVSFYDSTGAPAGHQWYMNGVLFSTSPNPVQTFGNLSSTDKLLNIKLVFKAGSGCSDSITKSITIFPRPQANFSIPASVCAGGSLQATNLSTFKGATATYLWSVSPAIASISDTTAANPNFVFPDFNNGFDSTYLVCLTVISADGCRDTNCQNILVRSRPKADFSLPAAACAPLRLSPADQSSGAGLVYQWSVLPFANVILSGSNTASPILSFSSPAQDSVIYTLKLMVIDANGCTDSISKTYPVYAQPSAGFSVARRDSCGPFTVTFNNSSTAGLSGAGQGLTYQWDFGNGQSSTLADPIAIFTNSGLMDSVFPIELIVQNSLGCSDTIADSITVHPGPRGEMLVVDSVNCAPFLIDVAAVQAVAYPQANSSYQWRVLDLQGNQLQQFAGANSLNYNLAQSGDSVLVQLIATSPFGCKADTVEQLFYTIENPVPNFAAVSDTLCSGGTVSFFDSSSAGVSHEWFINGNGNPFSTQANPSLVLLNNSFVNDSTVTIKLRTTAGSSGCADSISKTVLIHPRPLAQFSLPASLCANDSVQPVNTSLSGGSQSYYWSVSGTGVNISDSAAVQPWLHFPDNQSGSPITYSVQLLVTNAFGCADSLSQNIVINSKPVAGFSLPPNGCGPFMLSPTNNSSGSGLSYNWSISPISGVTGTFLSSAMPQFSFVSPAQDSVRYFIKLRLTDGNGCLDSLTKTFDLYPKPSAGFTASQTDSCGPLTVNFTNTSLPKITGQGLAHMGFQWDFGNSQTSQNTNPAITFTNTGTVDSVYGVQLIASNSKGCSDTSFESITVRPDPRAELSLTDTVNCSPFVLDSTVVKGVRYSTANAAYDWKVFDVQGILIQQFSGAGGMNYSLTTGGDSIVVQLMVTSPFGCKTDTVEQLFYTIENPVPNFAALPDTLCSGGTVSFFDSSSTGVSHEWFINGNGNPFSTQANPSLVLLNNSFVNDSLVSIKLRITAGTSGCKDSVSKTVLIRPRPLAQFSLPASLCANDSVQPVNTSLSGGSQSYYWSVSGTGVNISDSAAAQPWLHFPDNQSGSPITYAVQLLITNAFGCADSLSQNIVINSRPVAGFSLPPNGCGPLVLSPTNNSSGSGLSYNWSISPISGVTGTFLNSAMPQFSFVSPAQDSLRYFIKLTLTDGNGCLDTLTQSFDVYPKPVAAFTASQTDSCGPLTVNFTNTSLTKITGQGLADMGFQWDFGNSQTSQSATPSVTFTNTGTVDSVYTVQLIATNSTGCSDTSFESITVRPDPRAELDTSLTFGCTPFLLDSSVVKAMLYPGANASYLWTVLDPKTQAVLQSFTGPKAMNHTMLNSGDTVLIRLVAPSLFGCKGDTAEQLFRTIPNPVPGFVPDTTQGCHPLSVTLTDTSSPGLSYAWYINGKLQSTTAASPVFTLTNTSLTVDSVYQIKLVATAGTGCKDSTAQSFTVFALPDPAFTATEVCGGDTSLFTNTTFTLDTILQWQWDFGDGNSSGQENPRHAYASFGTYTVSLTATDSRGCPQTYFDTVIVRPNPVADFSAAKSCGPDTACLNRPFSFSDLSTLDPLGGSLTNWEWDILNDGILDYTAQNPQHTFTQSGLFDVKLSVQSQYGCRDTVVRQIQVLDPLVAFFVTDTTATCGPLDVVATDSSGGPVTQYLWELYSLDTLGNRANTLYTSGQQNPNPLPTLQPGYVNDTTYLLKLRVNNCCDTVSHQQAFTLRPLPVAGMVALPPVGCSGFKVDFTIDGHTTGRPDSVVLKFGDGSPLKILMPYQVYYQGDTIFVFGGQSHIFNNPLTKDTTYFVSLRAVNDCGDSTIQLPILVHPNIVQASFTYSPGQGCEDLSVNFSDASFGGNTFAWFFDYDSLANTNNQFSDSGKVVSHTYADPGSYLVAYIVSDGCSNDTAYATVNVFDAPQAAFTSNNNVCEGDSIFFSNQTAWAPASIGIYRWYFGDGDSALQKDPVHVYDTSGTFSVWLVAFSPNGCRDSISHQVTIHDRPDVDFYVENACVGTPLIFVDSTMVKNASISKTTWRMDTLGTFFSNPSPFIISTPGSYQVTLIQESSTGCVDSLTKTVEVFEVPKARFGVKRDTTVDTCGNISAYIFRDSSISSSPLQYLWDFDLANAGTRTSQLRNPGSQVYTDTGLVYISLTVWNSDSCWDTFTDTLYVEPKSRVDFSPLFPEACMGEIIQFNDSTRYRSGAGNNVLTYLWDFGDGNTSTSKNPQHTYTAAGVYTVKLKVWDPSCVDSLSREVTIHQTPEADILPGNYELCARDVISISSQTLMNFPNGDVVDSLVWIVSDGREVRVFRDTLVDLYFDQPGQYKLGLVAITDKGCRDTADATVKIVAHPTPVVLLDQEPINARTFNLIPDVMDGENGHFHWDFGNGDSRVSERLDTIPYRYDDRLCRIDSMVHHQVTLTVINQIENFGQCMDADTIEITMEGYHLNVPNAFAPERNNVEDANLFLPKGKLLAHYRLRVFDEWGNMIFETEKLNGKGSPMEGWNGRYKGEVMPMGAYVWTIDAEFNDGYTWPVQECNSENIRAYGTVTLIR